MSLDKSLHDPIYGSIVGIGSHRISALNPELIFFPEVSEAHTMETILHHPKSHIALGYMCFGDPACEISSTNHMGHMGYLAASSLRILVLEFLGLGQMIPKA